MGFDNIGMAEVAVILVVALFVFGPDRLPGLAADLGRGLRNLRRALKGMTEDVRSELGPEFQDVDLRSLHPRAFVQKHLLSDDDDDLQRTPRRRVSNPLQPGETPPFDRDAT